MAFLPHFLLFNILLATSQARNVPASTENTKTQNSDQFSSQKDVSFSVPGLGEVTVPTVGGYGGSSPYTGAGGAGTIGGSGGDDNSGDGSIGGTGDDGSIGGVGGDGNSGDGSIGGDGNSGEGSIGGVGGDGGIGGVGGDNSGVGTIGGDNSSGQGGIGGAGGDGNSSVLGEPRRTYLPGGDDTLMPNPGFEIPNPLGGVFPIPTQP